jgi:hypothetical protein
MLLAGMGLAWALATPRADPVAAGGRDMRQALQAYPHIEDTVLDSCALCHVSETNYGLDAYGRDYEDARGAFAAIENDDSDGDGFDNITEITALTFPGKADSVPTGQPTPPDGTVTATPTETPSATVTTSPSLTPGQPTPTPTPFTDTPTPVPDHELFVPWAHHG